MQICSLVKQNPKGVNEYVAAVKPDQHPILAKQEEQFITLQMPKDFPLQWKSLGFSHIHFGAFIVALTYHGRKCQPVVARTAFVTIFPNFNISLQDPYLTEVLKILVQILGAPQARDAIQATLHYQLAWRVQNHAMDLSLLGCQNALFLSVESTNGTTQCTQIPRQICRDELFKVRFDTWVTNYEKLRGHPQPLQSTEPTFSKKSDNKVAICFDHSHLKIVHKTAFSIHMYQPLDSLRHIPWDINSDCTECEEDYYKSEDDDEGDYDEYSYDIAKWDEEEYQFLVSHKPQD
ncbi:hypothetical protein RDI58_014816 [Solanum bulbocastanum]|uniref:Uncharacterized protein n=1 Tax=Solanum bulbocastanum TaxID=147425 RepID=A0AAN8TM40_SOLBU